MPASGNRRVARRPTLPKLLALAIALVLGASPGVAAAASDFTSGGGDPYGSAPGGQSAGDQYVETLPTTRGPRAPGHRKHAKKLSRKVTKQIDTLGGSDAAQLKTLATSPSLGAPQERPKSGGKSSRKSASRSGNRHGGTEPAVPSAAINAVDGGEAGLGWLVVALLAITALALGAAGYQRRRHRGSDR
jgi:hypothetical protein